jgi:hypothetical protein
MFCRKVYKDGFANATHDEVLYHIQWMISILF